MVRGTTPTLNFTLPFNASEITTCYITFVQAGLPVIEKTLNDCTYEGKVLSLELSETDTLKFNYQLQAEIQIRCACGDVKLASNIISVPVGRILKEGII